MWPQIIGSIATGLTGLVVAVAGLLTARSQGTSTELATCRDELVLSRRQLVVSIRHMYRLERLLANTGASVPSRPQEVRDLVS